MPIRVLRHATENAQMGVSAMQDLCSKLDNVLPKRVVDALMLISTTERYIQSLKLNNPLSALKLLTRALNGNSDSLNDI